MKTIKIFWIATLLATLTACSGGGGEDGNSGNEGTVSTTSDGNCTSAFIFSYNSIVFEALTLKNYIDWKRSNSEIFHQAQVLKNACDQFFPKHENVSCKAEVDYKETMISSNDQKPKCQAAQKVLDLQNGSNQHLIDGHVAIDFYRENAAPPEQQLTLFSTSLCLGAA